MVGFMLSDVGWPGAICVGGHSPYRQFITIPTMGSQGQETSLHIHTALNYNTLPVLTETNSVQQGLPMVHIQCAVWSSHIPNNSVQQDLLKKINVPQSHYITHIGVSNRAFLKLQCAAHPIQNTNNRVQQDLLNIQGSTLP